MRVARVAGVFVTLTAFAGCSLFSDLGSYSDDPSVSSPEAGSAPDGPTTTDGSSGGSDAPPTGDAGPDASAYKQAVLADQPVAYWPFDEAPGANLAKEIIGGKNAEVLGNVTFGVKGADGTAISRDAAGGHLEVGDYFDLAGTQAYSIEFWGWPKGTGEFENILHKRNANGKGWIVYFRDGSDSVQIEQPYVAGGRTTFAPLPVPKDRMHHIVFVHEPMDPTEKRQRVYIDTIRTNGFSDDGPADDVTTPLTMFDFVGVLDEVAIYHHALSAERIAKHYELGAKLP
jgi:hypothetical protein